MLFTRAMCRRARKSFGRQEPPKAKPGRRYAVEMLSRLSWQKIRMTSRVSTPITWHSRPNSLVKLTFTAW